MDIENISDVYEQTYRSLRLNGAEKKDAHKESMDKLKNMFSELREVTFKNQKFAGAIGNVKQRVDREIEPNIIRFSSEEKVEQVRLERQSRMDTFRAMAKTGFIPYGEYLAPLIGKKKSKQASAYVSHLKKEGWENERVEHGWIISRRDEERELLIEELEELRNRIKDISDKLEV